MFVLVIVVTLTIQGIFKPFGSEYTFYAHNPTSFTIFLSVSWLALFIYVFWGLAFVISLLPLDRRPNILCYLSKLGANGNMLVLQLLLFIGSFLLIGSGWFTGNASTFVAGTILIMGLLGNSIEQRSLIW